MGGLLILILDIDLVKPPHQEIDRLIHFHLDPMDPSAPSDSCEMSHDVHKSLETIFKNNREWAVEKGRADPAFFEKLADGQAPNYL